jgi:CheY-like chemotaxis protein
LLEHLRQEPAWREIPVTVLSGSNYSPDVSRAYELGAKSFLEKTADIRQFSSSIKATVERWIGAASASTQKVRLSWI